jgi:hypothetical protein
VQRPLAGLQQLREPGAQRREQRLDVVELAQGDAAVEILENVVGGLDADIGAQQPRLPLFPDRGVDLATGQQAAQVARDRGGAAVQA